jgi:hypothetical protein
MDRFPFDEFGSAFQRSPRRFDDLREREIDGPFLPRQSLLTSVMVGAAIWVLVLAFAERSSSVNGRLAAASGSLATPSSDAQLAHHRDR